MSCRCLLVLALGGCDQVLGLKMVEQPPLEVVGTFRARTVVNDSNFEPLRVERVMAAANLSFRVILEDGSEPEVRYNEDSGTFRFVVPEEGVPYRLLYLADGLAGEIQHDVARLVIGTTQAGRPDASPLVRSEVAFNYPMVPVRTAWVTSTGIYTQTDTALTGPVVELDWRLANSVGGVGTRMLDADAYDRVFAIEPESVSGEANSPPWTRFRALSASSISQASGTSVMLPVPSVVAANTCVHLVVNGNDEHLRIKSADPRMYVQESQNWITYAAPALDYVALAGVLTTASCGVVTPGTTNFDFNVTPSFHNPYAGTTTVASSSAVASFYIQSPPADSLLISNVTTVRDLIEEGTPPSCNPAVTTITPTIAIPGKFELDGVDLAFDNERITVDTLQAPLLEWEHLTEGPADYYAVSLQEVAAINNKTVIIPRWSATTPYRRARVEPKYLVAGRTYIIAVTAATGRPNLIDGDLLTMSSRIETATFFSHTFTVQAL